MEQVEHASSAGFTSHSLYFLPNVEQKLLETTKQELLDAVEKVNKKKMKTVRRLEALTDVMAL